MQKESWNKNVPNLFKKKKTPQIRTWCFLALSQEYRNVLRGARSFILEYSCSWLAVWLGTGIHRQCRAVCDSPSIGFGWLFACGSPGLWWQIIPGIMIFSLPVEILTFKYPNTANRCWFMLLMCFSQNSCCGLIFKASIFWLLVSPI